MYHVGKLRNHGLIPTSGTVRIRLIMNLRTACACSYTYDRADTLANALLPPFERETSASVMVCAEDQTRTPPLLYLVQITQGDTSSVEPTKADAGQLVVKPAGVWETCWDSASSMSFYYNTVRRSNSHLYLKYHVLGFAKRLPVHVNCFAPSEIDSVYGLKA